MKAFVLGSVNVDVVASAKSLPRKGETIEGTRVDYFIGGKGANQAVQLACLGAETYFIGNIGGDGNGITAKNGLIEKGVNVNFLSVDDESTTGCAVIYIDPKGDNTLVYAPGANRTITKHMVDAAYDTMKECDVFITQAEINLDMMEYGLETAKKHGIITVLNPTPAIPLPDRVFELTDYIAPNETESEQYTGIYRTDMSIDIWMKKNAEWFMTRGVGNVIITMGEKGAYFYNGKEEHFVKAFQITPVDTTAAGDSFIGGFSYGLAAKMPVDEAMRMGCACGGMTAQSLGAQNSIRPMKDVMKLIESQR